MKITTKDAIGAAGTIVGYGLTVSSGPVVTIAGVVFGAVFMVFCSRNAFMLF